MPKTAKTDSRAEPAAEGKGRGRSFDRRKKHRKRKLPGHEGGTMTTGRHQIELGDSIDLLSGRVDQGAGVVRGVKIIGAQSGHEDFGKSRRYTAEALEAAVKLYEGIPVNIDHPMDDRGKFDPGRIRRTEDRIGLLENVTFAKAESSTRGDLKLLQSHPIAARVLEAAGDPSLSKLFGLSHNAVGVGEVKGEEFVIDEIRSVRSVDIVPDPATTMGLFESDPTAGSGGPEGPGAADGTNAGEGAVGEKIRQDKREEDLRRLNGTAMGMIHDVMFDEDGATDLSLKGKRDKISSILDDWQGEVGDLPATEPVGEPAASTSESTDGDTPMAESKPAKIEYAPITADGLRAYRPDLVEQLQEAIAPGHKKLEALAASQAAQIDAFETRQKLADKRYRALRLCQTARIPPDAVTETFIATLCEAQTDEDMQTLVEDRRRVCRSPGPRAREQIFTEGVALGEGEDVAVDMEKATKQAVEAGLI